MANKREPRNMDSKTRLDATQGDRHWERMLYDAAQIEAEPELAKIFARYRDMAMAPQTYRHAPRNARIVAELGDLLKLDGVVHANYRNLISEYIDLIKKRFKLPKWLAFYPRDHVPTGGLPYEEDFVRVENFTQVSTALGPRTFASGFASFNAGSGVFSLVGYSMGTAADVRAGPIVTLKSQQDPVDVVLTSHFLLDYQYQMSASLNPAFQPSSGTSQESEIFKLDLLLDIDIRDVNGRSIGGSQPLKHVKHAELRPDASSPPYIAGNQEIISGSNLQGSDINVPTTWVYQFSVPSNCSARISVAVAPFVIASGYRGSTSYRHLGIADGRASGQVTSVEAMLFS